MMKLFFRLIFCFLLIPFGISCSTEVDINATEKPIWAVFGVLNQEALEQNIRVSMGFLPEGNALEFARENDLSVKDLRVSLIAASGKVYQATQIDSVLKTPTDGTFYELTSLYRFDTEGDNQLVAGERYTLRVTKLGDDEFELRAETAVPTVPNVTRPVITNCTGNGRGLQSISLDRETRVEWAAKRASLDGQEGSAFELRVYFAYQEDGNPDTVQFGPTRMIETKACGTQFCYRFREKELISNFLTKIDQQTGSLYTYQDEPTCGAEETLAQAFWYEITAVDTFLYRYRQANDPLFTDFNTTRPEYTNISGTETAVGVLGSISIARRYAAFNTCTKYLLNMNEIPQPNPSCVLEP